MKCTVKNILQDVEKRYFEACHEFKRAHDSWRSAKSVSSKIYWQGKKDYWDGFGNALLAVFNLWNLEN